MSVAICAYTEERWTLLVRAVRSVAAQTRHPAALVVVVDGWLLLSGCVVLPPQTLLRPALDRSAR